MFFCPPGQAFGGGRPTSCGSEPTRGADAEPTRTLVVAITFTFLTGVKLVITEGLPAWDHSDDESIRKKNLLTYAFLIAPAVAPIVYMWGVL